MNITIKQTKSNPNWEMFSKLDPYLSELFFICCNYLLERDVDSIEITSIIRPHIQGVDSGLHADGRAIDFSQNSIPSNIGIALQSYINDNYKYDIDRPWLETLVFHDGSGYLGDKALHYHLQVNSRKS